MVPPVARGNRVDGKGRGIPLHPDDAPRFAFSVPTLNREAPRKRYRWKFLPQGMKNSPSICQWYLSSLLSPVRAAVGEAIILHYMDDVLVCAPNDDLLSHMLDLTIDSLVAAGFELQEEKIQRMPPWKYLGLEIAKVEEMGDCDSAHCPLEGGDGFSSPAGAAETMISGGVEVPPSQASAPVPVESTGRDLAGATAFPGGYQAFPVICGATNNSHQAISWKALMDLRDKVGKYGLGSIEVMQVLRVFNADVLPRYDIWCVACVLFQSVKYDIFESKWTQLAGRVIAQNTVLGQQDSRHVIGTDELLGTGNFADLHRQVVLDPLVLDQCQKTGMAALIQTIEMAAPKESFVTVVQGAEEPFL
ncbi:hypothetical protein DUI87_01401 [Hirundo rustica rustica]|uniref:ribonuclease H n=1 Tax=Hirundo rustica rustica TaxID=333673 RepID=A0A3M0LBX2_HIRRU|nr:hypothetical protein DUI87_01401 [Hirundo rustica rustica]